MSKRRNPRSAASATTSRDTRQTKGDRVPASHGGTAPANRPGANRSVARRRPVQPRRNRAFVLAGAAVAALVLGVLAIAMLGGSKSGAEGAIVQGRGGQWTDINANRLATMLGHKDFTLLNVKTPYSGEIARTDLYIPYDQLAARAAELPADKTAPLVVYCRTGHESAIAAQTLLDLGYTNIDNLDGGMTAWTASGRDLVTLDRSGG